MPSPASPAAGADGALTFALTRMIEAPREAVFKAWTDPALIARWLGPSGVRAEVRHIDARRGGSYRIDMQGTSGSLGIVGGIYREVVPPERLVFTWILGGEWTDPQRRARDGGHRHLARGRPPHRGDAAP